MVKSTAETNLMYRGFIIKVRASKESDGCKSVHTHIRYHIPELKPKYAKHVDKREQIETQEGEIECMRTYDTIGPVEADSLTVSRYHNPSFDNNDSGMFPSWIPVIGSEDTTNPEPAISTMVREVVEGVESNIDEYIRAHSLVEVSKDEVMHGLEQSVSEPLSDVEVNTPQMNTDSEYDSIRPNVDEISEELALEQDS